MKRHKINNPVSGRRFVQNKAVKVGNPKGTRKGRHHSG